MTTQGEFWRFVFCPTAAGTLVLVVGLIVLGRRIGKSPDTWPVLGRVFVAASLAAFGGEHLASARGTLARLIPTWMPFPLLTAYLVGIALFAAAASIVSGRKIRLAASLLGTMFFIFVLSIHIPRVAATHSDDRFSWAVVTRDFTFGLGAWMLAAASPDDREARWPRVIAACRIVAGLVFVFYGVEHMLHPMFVPGVPLERLMGPWVPACSCLGHVIGLLLIAVGVLMVIDVQARAAATWLGAALTVTTPGH